MTHAIASTELPRNSLLVIAGGGLLSGILTPLLPALVDKIVGSAADLRLAIVAVPFAVVVSIVVRRNSTNPWWAALIAALITMIAFVCAINAAVFIDGQTNGASKMMRNILAGLAGGLVGTVVMALGIALLPAGPRNVLAWLRMLLTGTLAGTLLRARQRTWPRFDLVSFSGLAGGSRGAAGDGLARAPAFLKIIPALPAAGARPKRILRENS